MCLYGLNYLLHLQVVRYKIKLLCYRNIFIQIRGLENITNGIISHKFEGTPC